MQLKFEKFRDRFGDKYLAVLVSTQHAVDDEPERVEIAALEKREVTGGANRHDWEIEWRHPTLARDSKFSYEDLFNDAKRAVLTLLRGRT